MVIVFAVILVHDLLFVTVHKKDWLAEHGLGNWDVMNKNGDNTYCSNIMMQSCWNRLLELSRPYTCVKGDDWWMSFSKSSAIITVVLKSAHIGDPGKNTSPVRLQMPFKACTEHITSFCTVTISTSCRVTRWSKGSLSEKYHVSQCSLPHCPHLQSLHSQLVRTVGSETLCMVHWWRRQKYRHGRHIIGLRNGGYESCLTLQIPIALYGCIKYHAKMLTETTFTIICWWKSEYVMHLQVLTKLHLKYWASVCVATAIVLSV